MKPFLSLLLCLFAVSIEAYVCYENDYDEYPIIEYGQEYIDTMEDISDMIGCDYLLSIPKNTQIPLRVAVTGPVMRFEGASNIRVKLLQQAFFINKKGNFLISFDKKNWKDFEDLLLIDFDFSLSSEKKKGFVLNVNVDVQVNND